ncbi:MAG TPA: carbonic anhydrase, partial [Planctomycetaceae bacterium]|nr:carbonic anhydrase [Planctomycetaceae bacterium]
VLGSMEYGCAVAGAKLILVMGHTRCGAVTAAVELACTHNNAELATGCQHLQPIVEDIQQSIEAATCDRVRSANPTEKNAVVDQVARRNVEREMARIVEESDTIRWLVEANRVAVVGAMYDVATGEIEFFEGPHRN